MINNRLINLIYSSFLLFAVAFFFWIFYGHSVQTSEYARKAIIIGATSGIGAALAKELAKRSYIVGITGRRKNLLEALALEIPTKTYTAVLDVSNTQEARNKLKELIRDMNDIDVIIINAGTGNTDLTWDKQKEIIDVNVMGFAAMASVATDYFLEKDLGHIVGISSIAALRGSAAAPVYSASKAFISNYLEGLRARFARLNKPIYVTNIQPGLVDTAMGQVSSFWRATPEQAAYQIANAIDKKYNHAYITKRWRLVAWVFKFLPDFLFYKLF